MNPLIIGTAFILLISQGRDCGRKPAPLNPVDYVQWVENSENGLAVSKQLAGLNFELQYTPHEYVILRDEPEQTFSAAEMEVMKSGISEMQYFTLRISDEKSGDLLRNDVSCIEDFSARLAYFSSSMQHDLKLIEGNDTLSCLLFHFERTYGVDPRSTFLIGFPFSKSSGMNIPVSADKTFFFDDHELGTGPVYLTISSKELNQLPPLNLK